VFEQYPVLADIIISEWHRLPDRFPTVSLDAFVVMPNHIHFVLWLSADPIEAPLAGARETSLQNQTPVPERAGASPAPTPEHRPEAGTESDSDVGAPLAGARETSVDEQPPLPERAGTSPAPTLGDVVGAFKSRVAVRWLQFARSAASDLPAKVWQRGYYERVIRDEAELHRVRQYIQNNRYNGASTARTRIVTPTMCTIRNGAGSKAG
jgi:REP element-mobilizing transposase RayT